MTYQKLELESVFSPNQSENLEQNYPHQTTKKNKEHFAKIAEVQKRIQKIKAALNQIIEAMNQNPSLLSQAAIIWNEVPLWQKITVGIVLTVPIFMIGLMANLAALITLGIVAGVVYTAGSILLDNHQGKTTENIEGLKAGISSLAELLDSVLFTLELLGEQLAIEIDAFQKENARLTAHIEQFPEQMKLLHLQINNLTDNEKALRIIQIELELKAKTLMGFVDAKSQALENTQKELEQVVYAYKENQSQLSDKIKELDEVKEKMGKEVEQARAVVQVLRGTVETFSNMVIQDKEQHVAFQKKLEEFLTNKEKSFIEVAQRICEAEYKLSEVTKESEESNQRYRSLLDEQEQQIIRLEQIEVLQSDEGLDSFGGVKPSINGFYAIKKEPSLLPVSTPGNAMVAVV